MRVILSRVEDRSIILEFDEQIDQSSFMPSMLILEKDSQIIEFSHQIDGNLLKIIPNTLQTGTYYLYLSGYDLLSNKYLKSTSGSAINETYSYEFLLSQPNNEPPTGEVPPTVVDLTTSQVEVNYTKLLLSDRFVQTFNKAITQPFTQQVTIEDFDGGVSQYQYDVTEQSTPISYSQNNLVLYFGKSITNQIVTIDQNITFGDITQQFNLTQLGQLKPYINLRQAMQQFGSYSGQISDQDQWYAALAQMVAYEWNSGVSIIGKDLTDTSQKLFLQKYQYFELLKMMMNRKILSSGDSINTGVSSITMGRISTDQIKFIEDQQQELIQQFVSIITPTSQNKQMKSNIMLHSTAVRQLKIWEHIFQGRPVL